MGGSRTCVRYLGVASGWPTSTSGFSAFLIEHGEDRVLVDAGEPVSIELTRQRIPIGTIRTVFISHMHADHFSGLFMFLQTAWLVRRRQPLDVYLPYHAVQPFSDFLKQVLLPPEIFPFRLMVHSIVAGAQVCSGPFTTTAVKTSHLDYLRKRYGQELPSDASSYGFRVAIGDLVIGYTGDIGEVDDLDRVVGNGVDLLICELAHCEAEPLLLRLARLNVKKVALVHIAPQYAQQMDLLSLQAQKVLGYDRVVIPSAGYVMSVG